MEEEKDLLYEKFRDRCADNGITGEEGGDIEMCWIIARDILTQERQQELDKARREYFSMGMEYFSLIDDSNIYQQKGWKLSEEKAERLKILDKMFKLLKDNK